MIQLIVDQEFGSLVVPGSHPHIILLLRLVKVSQTPVNQPQVSPVVVDHYVQRLDVTVHDSVLVRILKCLKNFVRVKHDVELIEVVIELFGLH